jgi:2-polyprenyl-3-methyl-5-hydroxy-6-metoxy-1,4-benzoquinol methylase
MTSCPACRKERFTERNIIAGLSTRTCLQCGLIISSISRAEAATAEFERIDDKAYFEAVGRVRMDQAVAALSFVREYGPSDGDWLDIGCSFGYLLRAAAADGYKVFGVEPDRKAYEHACQLLGAETIYHGLMRDDTRPDASARIISTMDVLEHIEPAELSKFASMVHRKLQSGGFWLIKVPSSEGIYFILAHRLIRFARFLMTGAVKRLWQSEYEFPHRVYFNLQALTTYLENHGFKVLSHRYLEEVPSGTILHRLLMDDTISKWQAYVMAPAFYAINLIEKLRGKSDALLVLAGR